MAEETKETSSSTLYQNIILENSTAAQYIYDPLPTPRSLRILEILPASNESPISAVLKTCTLDALPEYEAISYVWGNPYGEPAFCYVKHGEERTQEHPLRVTLNCWGALHRLRKRDVKRAVWIDAICINQEDPDERTQQVALMEAIYREAAKVVVFLDRYEGDEEAGKIFSLARELEEKGDDAFLEACGMSFKDGDTAKALFGVLRNTWFHRCWTLQEIALAKEAELVCGDDAVEWRVFWEFIIFIDRKMPHVKVNLLLPTTDIISSIGMYQRAEDEKKIDFIDVLQANRNRKATDPVDHIYAFLGHPSAKTGDKLIMQPDYRKGEWVVFYHLALIYLQETGDLRILSAVDHGEQLPNPYMPLSWVPWWNSTESFRSFGLSASNFDASRGYEKRQSIRIAGKLIADVDIEHILDSSPLTKWEDLRLSSLFSSEKAERERNDFLIAHAMSFSPLVTSPEGIMQLLFAPEALLSLRGIIIDRIQGVSRVLQREDFISTSFDTSTATKKHFLASLREKVMSEGGGCRYEDKELALSLLLTGGTLVGEDASESNERDDEKQKKHLAAFAAYQLMLYTNNRHINPSDDPSTTSQPNIDDLKSLATAYPSVSWEDYMIPTATACHNRRLLFTNTGFWGLGPNAISCEGSDYICVFYGAKTPFMLRPLGEGRFKLVGEAYVQGLMGGEAMEMLETGEVEEMGIQIF